MGHDHCPCSEETMQPPNERTRLKSRVHETESIEERFVKRLERMRIWEFGHAAETGAVYVTEEDYDAVLKSHCPPPGTHGAASHKRRVRARRPGPPGGR